MKFVDLKQEFAPPDIAAAEASSVLQAHYGIRGRLRPLGGERDRNFHVAAADGRDLVLKISGATESDEAIDLQAELLEHLERAGFGGAPRGVRTTQGELYFRHGFETGTEHTVRLVTYVAGTPLSADAVGQRRTVRDLGRLQGRLCRALSGFFHRAARRPMPWDIGNGLAFDDTLLASLTVDVRAAIAPHLARLKEETLPALRNLRGQVIHNDVHPGNVLIDGGGHPAGLIDFGDAMHAPLVQDIASAAASLAEAETGHCGEALEALEQGFHAAFPLLAEERDILPDATLLRGLLCVELVGFKLSLMPDNESQAAALASSTRGLMNLIALRGEKSAARNTAVLRRREEVMSPNYRLHYDEPVQLVRGKGTKLFDAEGREYLDGYNNVPSVGHGHPHVVEALARQAAALNTHTRYLHDGIVTYAERLSDTFPEKLDRCQFVCSGTEANELAYNIARTVTGREGAIVTLGAYHGNSIAIGALSVEGKARADYPAHVVPVVPPDTYRGPFGPDEADVGEKLAAEVDAAIDELERSPHGLAMLLIDAIFDAPGIFTAPPGYLAGLFKRVREAGGIVVVDEVQSGLCRLGDHMWGFQDSDVVPDIVTMGKPMGNGHPLAVVAARHEILEAFAARQHYFNTFAGNPVAAAAGNAVLDVVEDEDVLGNVNRVGRHLRNGLDGLARDHDMIGDVRGKGLYFGIDLVSDRPTRTPSSAAAHRVVNGLRHRGVLVAVNGAHDNVIKIRPPLVFSEADADRLVEALDAEMRAEPLQ